MNLITKLVVHENVKQDLCKQSTIGQTLFTNFVNDRIKQGKVSIWIPMKKRKLLTWKTTGKVLNVAAQDKTVELKEDRSLFAIMMMICKIRPEIDIKGGCRNVRDLSSSKLNVCPRGTMLHCSSKSNLMDILGTMERMLQESQHLRAQTTTQVSIVDAMAEVQALDKPAWIKNCF